MVKDPSRYFRKDTQIMSKHMKKYSPSMSSEKSQADARTEELILNWWVIKNVEQFKCSYFAGGRIYMYTSILEKLTIATKIKYIPTF